MTNQDPSTSMPNLKPMNLGELIDQTFKVYRRAWKPLVLIGLFSTLPTIVYSGFMNMLLTVSAKSSPQNNFIIRIIQGISRNDFSALWNFLSVVALSVLVSIALAPLLRGATIAICSHAFLGRVISVGEGVRIALSRYWRLLGTAVLTVILYIIAFPVLIIGGLVILAPFTLLCGYVAMTVYTAFTAHAILIEEVSGGVPAYKRSIEIVKGRFWPLLGLGILFTALLAILSGIVGLLTQFPAQLLHTFVFKNAISAWVLAVLQGLPVVFSGPFTVLGLTLAYYDSRMRKEGFDLEYQNAATESTPP